jgi:hypothetical protein
MFNCLAILLLALAAAFCHYGVNYISEMFVETRVAEVTFFSKLVRDNWDGIKSVPDEKKKVLLQNLDPVLAGFDIRAMRTIALVFLYLLYAVLILDRADALFKLWKASRQNIPAP